MPTEFRPRHNSTGKINPRHSSGDMSEHEEIIHPNEEKSVISAPVGRTASYLLGMEPVAEHKSWVNSRFVAWFIQFDEMKLRPFLIRKYDIGNIVLADQLDDAMQRKIGDVDDLDASMRMMDIIQL